MLPASQPFDRKEINRGARLKIQEHGAVFAPATKRKIVNAKQRRVLVGSGRRRSVRRIVLRLCRQPGLVPSCAPARPERREANFGQSSPKARRHAGRDLRQGGKALSKDLARAVLLVTEKASHLHHQAKRFRATRHIVQRSRVVAMYALGQGLTNGAGRFRSLDMGLDRNRFGIHFSRSRLIPGSSNKREGFHDFFTSDTHIPQFQPDGI